jgi:hypothetical protein
MCDGGIQLRRITPSIGKPPGLIKLLQMWLKDAAPILRGYAQEAPLREVAYGFVLGIGNRFCIRGFRLARLTAD